MEQVELKYNNKSIYLPIIEGSDGKKAIDISELYSNSNLIIFDPGLFNTSNVESKISRRDPDSGELSYRGFDINDLVENCTFVEVAFLLIYGHLPKQTELKDFSKRLSNHSLIHEDMINLFDGFPGIANPLAILSTMVMSLSSYYPDEYEESLEKGIDLVARLIAKIRTIAAFSYKKMIGQPFMYPQDRFSYCTNFLYMLFSLPPENYDPPKEHDRILNQIWILYADHEQNVSATTVQVVGSTKANLFASISSAISALWGSREGNRSVEVMEMIEEISSKKIDVKKYFEDYKTGKKPFSSNGFGDPAYNVKSKRSEVAKRIFKDYFADKKLDSITEIALKINEYTLNDPFFIEKKLYPNLDFYSAIIFYSLGIPKELFNVMQVIGKLPGWLAHWIEQRQSGDFVKVRSKQVYKGSLNNKFVPMDQRK